MCYVSGSIVLLPPMHVDNLINDPKPYTDPIMAEFLHIRQYFQHKYNQPDIQSYVLINNLNKIRWDYMKITLR